MTETQEQPKVKVKLISASTKKSKRKHRGMGQVVLHTKDSKGVTHSQTRHMLIGEAEELGLTGWGE